MTRRSDNKRAFYVVQFIELPFENIDDYVCVPYTWLTVRKAMYDKVVVAYPNDEDPFDTRDRVERKERYNDKWRFYMATVEYKSDSFDDAEFWIAARNDYGPLVEEESKVTDKQPKHPVNKKLRSAHQNHLSKSNDNFRKPLPRISNKRPANTKTKKEIDEKRLKIDKSAPSSSAVVNDAKVEARSPKRKQSVIIQDNQSMECSQTEESSVASNADESTESRSKIPHTEQTDQALSSPVTDIDKRTQVINIDDEDHSQRVKKPDHNNSMSQANSSSNTTDVSMTSTKPSTSAEQSTQPNQYNHQEYILDRCSLSNFQPQIENVRSLANVDDHKQIVNEVPSQKLPTSYKELNSLKLSAQLYSHMNGGRRLIPIQKQVEKRLRPTKMERNLAIATPKLRIGISIKPKDRKRKSSLQGVTKTSPSSIMTNVLKSIRQTLSTTHNNFLLNNPQLQARMSPRSTEDNNVDFTTSPQNIIASETGDRQNTEIPIHPIYQPSRIQHTTVHENGYQNLCTQEQLVNQSTQMNSKPKRVHFMDDAARSSVTGSHLNVMENASQRYEYIVKETLSPYHVVTSDSDAVTDHKEISDREMSADESPVETTDNVYGTANDPRHDSADRPTADQNSTSTNHQTHSKFILEQQMLDNFAILFTEMGSTLRYTTDMYNTLRSSILDTAETYKKLLGAVEQFNTAGNAASKAFPSSNLRPEGPRSPEARHTKVTVSASSSNQDQHRNDVANKTPKKKNNKLYQFVLPPEYDAYDTRWTLKYRTNLPGLVELMPQSGVYVSSGDLNYCRQVSKDCKSLARRLLPEVFNRNALSICSSMSEKAQASNNVDSTIRPDLDDHACSVLLNFVLEHGLQHGWNIDLQPILRTLHSKMQEIRFKYGVMVEC
ncbi:uncharacterized protein LOC123274088 [Cotesia glomerata]|nr:uncharacterized protein LOC123274088 [Cotesia glomerata]